MVHRPDGIGTGIGIGLGEAVAVAEGGDTASAIRTAREQLTAVVQTIARQVHGARPVARAPRSVTTLEVETIPGLKAAVLALGHVEAVVYDAVRQARADGCSWLVIAEQLGITGTVEHPADRAAFDHVVLGAPRRSRQRHSWRLSGPSMAWTCGSCGGVVTDRGPFPEGHPEDSEDGHFERCERRNAAVQAYERRRR